MIENLRFKNSSGYIKATIDNQSIDIPLKEIIRLPTQINNISNNNTIPIYTKIPIDVEFYSKPYLLSDESAYEDNIDFNLYPIIDVIPMYKDKQHKKPDNTWEYQNIFASYDEYLQSEGLSPIDKGTVTIQIFNSNNDIVYEINTSFKNHRLTTELTDELSFGKYTVVIQYHGNKYYLPSDLSYEIYIQKRELRYKFHKDAYSGNPLEEINIKAQLYDALNNRVIPNCYINYIFDDEIHLIKSNENGYIDVNVTLPSQKDYCIGDIVIYDIQFYVNDDTYWSDIVKQNITMNKLDTQISAQVIPSDKNETEFYIKGNVIAHNYDMIENVKHGDLLLSFDDGQEYSDNVSSDGVFSFTLDATEFQNVASNDIETEPYNTVKDVKTQITLDTSASYPIGEEFAVKATVKKTTNTQNIHEGIVIFNMRTNDTLSKIITQYIAEVDNNGEAYGYFTPSTKGTYKIEAKYQGIFEYTNSKTSKNIKIV